LPICTRYYESQMPRVIFHDTNGRRVEVQAPAGHTAMEAAVDNGVAGVLAECGGACACATCHGYVADNWLARLKPVEEMEDAMLDAAAGRRTNSRLLCQIELDAGLDGLEITVADNGA
jgi:2Fe-2S ferredoxin